MLRKRVFLFLSILAFFIFAAGCGNNSIPGDSSAGPGEKPAQSQLFTAGKPGLLKVNFLDVGQADSILVQLPNGENMLVDAGNNDDGNTVVNYLHQAQVKKIDYLIGTHPHEDHIGGLDTVIKSLDIDKIYMPKVTTNTQTYEDVLNAVRTKGLKIIPARAGVEIINSGGLQAAVLAPNSPAYEDLNDYSAVVKITYKNVSFLLTGDAQEISEAEMVKSGLNLKADVLKVGHHGSHSSTSPAFLKAVNPRYAVISVGAGNDYGHPHRETLQRLSNVQIYRTDRNGTVVFTTDGKDFKVSTGKEQSQEAAKVDVDSRGRGLIKGNINSKGEKIYHLPGGANYEQTVPEKWFKTEAEARAEGFRPAKK